MGLLLGYYRTKDILLHDADIDLSRMLPKKEGISSLGAFACSGFSRSKPGICSTTHKRDRKASSTLVAICEQNYTIESISLGKCQGYRKEA